MTSFKRIVVGKKFKEIQVPNESIYNLVPNSIKVHDFHPRYQSKYSSATKQFYDDIKQSHKTMGFAKTPLKTPKDFLKKQTRDANKDIERKPFVCLNEGNRRPPIPKPSEAPPIIRDDEIDFKRINVLKVMKTPALRPTPKAANTRKGDSFILEFSGLVPKFCNKQEFGKTPRYLVKRRRNLDDMKEEFEKSLSGNKPYVLDDGEKDHLIEGLRANWEELNTRYLSLPLVIDTKVLQNRKLELERKLNLLEHDIYFLETNRNIDIYVLQE